MDTSGMDGKTILNIFLQRHCKRPVTKEDVVYHTEGVDGRYTTTLTLRCLEDVPQFIGEPCTSSKEAEKSAAAQAVERYKDEIAVMPPPAGQKRKASSSPSPFGSTMAADKGKGKGWGKAFFGKGGPKGWGPPPPWVLQQMSEWWGAWGGPWGPPPAAAWGPPVPAGAKGGGKRAAGIPALPSGVQQPQDNRTKLASILKKFCGRPLNKEDLVYSSSKYDEGYQVTITMNCLEGAPEFNSEVMPDERAAQNNVAGMALETYATEFASYTVDEPALQAAPAQMDAAAASLDTTSEEPKTVLNQFVQRLCGRPVTKQCVVYEAHPCSTGGFQACLTLNCVEGCPQFYGEVGRTTKEAEKFAAAAALRHYEDELTALNVGAPAKKKKKVANEYAVSPLLQGVDSFSEGALSAAEANNRALTYKSHLNSACMKLVRRTLMKGEIAYEVEDRLREGQMRKIATVNIPCLGEHLGETRWQGAECVDAKEAEQSAAAACLTYLMADPERAEVIKAPSSSKSAKKSGNKNMPGNTGIPTPFGSW